MTPEPDGVITDFQTPQNYRSGTVFVFLNGVLLERDWDDGFTELGGNTIQMKIAPKVLDTLIAMYEPLS